MSSQRTLSMLFTIHSWAGIVTGLLLFVVCFSGAVVVFKNEIDRWANPSLAALPRAQVPLSLDTLLRNVRDAYPRAQVEAIALPDAVTPSHFVYLREPGAAGMQPERFKVAVRSDDGRVVGRVDSQFGQFLRMLHVFLFVGPRWIVGFLGVAMLVLIATGFVIHRKILAELFTLRWGRSLRVVMSDLHKAAGIWGLGFHIVIALTGAWLGLAPVFERAAQSLQARPEAAVKAPTGAAAMRSLDELRATAVAAVPGLAPRRLVLQRWGRADAQAIFGGELAGHLASTTRVTLDGASGQVRQVLDPRRAGLLTQIDALMEPLHFGDFGGLPLKWLYFFLGLTPAFMSLSGTLIWLDGRRQRGAAGARITAPGRNADAV
ncbi:PepSY-associated TM helix [Xylophilus ampelinus]|nr:PepSY domain-containing protein [Variovorax sp.]VTY36340.1 PepSY-associated TM helix [Xylophilus ampelinus]